jgi:hypothetical protein
MYYFERITSRRVAVGIYMLMFELNLQFGMWLMYWLMSNFPMKELLDVADFCMNTYLSKTDLKN